MKKRARTTELPRWAVCIAVGVVALALILAYSSGPSLAEKKGESKDKGGSADELSNASCIECHNPDILKMSKEELAENVEVGEKPQPARPKPPYVTGELNLSIDTKKYEAGVHADTKCVECHKDIEEIPHKQRLQPVNCAECHDDSVETLQASAHGKKAGPKAPACIGCHDVHYGKGKDDYGDAFTKKVCVDCHQASGMDTLAQHTNLYEASVHLKALGCMMCHQGKKPGVHNIPPAKTMVASCEACHSKATILTKEKMQPMSLTAYVLQTGFINPDVMKKFGYVVGANRVPLLDLVIILVVIGTLALPIFHGGLRFLTRRKGDLHLPEEKIYLHPFIERLWHWVQALCIVMLVITGIMIHWPEKFPGWFDWSVTVHNWFGVTVVIAWLVWLIYNLSTGRISHYLPKKEDISPGIITQAKFYGYGIFKHEPHPYAPSEDNKFNPLQKIAYLKFQLLLMPLLLITGLVYMYPARFASFIAAIGGMTVLATIHYILGALFAAFLLAHLYLATTGETIGENFKAIVFGYGIKAEHGEHHEKV